MYQINLMDTTNLHDVLRHLYLNKKKKKQSKAYKAECSILMVVIQCLCVLLFKILFEEGQQKLKKKNFRYLCIMRNS